MPSLRLVPGELQDAATWEFVLEGQLTAWDWTLGAPPVRQLEPTRRIRSGALSRHVPVLAASQTTGTTLALESGLELELLLWLDRQPEVVHIVPQPTRLRWGPRRAHTPDLLAESEYHGVTLWDARSPERQDEDFLAVTQATAEACARVGWTYEVFSGLPLTASLNLRWLAGARRPPEWLAASRVRLLDVVAGGCTVGEVVDADGGGGYLLSSMWHLAWTGEISIDLHEQWGESTALRLVGGQ